MRSSCGFAGFHSHVSSALVQPMKIFVSVAVLVFAFVARASAADDLKAFPPAEKGMTRFIIQLAEQEDESAFKVELIIGKMVKTDAKNRYFFGGTLETETIPGWGSQRYILRKLRPMAGTLMAVDPNAPQVERFIGLGGEPRLLRYNSRLPLVVYVPMGVKVSHRIWRADPPPRYVHKLALPTAQTAVVAEGDFEARSIGSYSVRIYSTENAQPGDDTTFFVAGLVRARDGKVEKVSLVALGDGGPSSLIVTIRSAGSGGYLSADAFTIDKRSVSLRASVSGLPGNADPVVALKGQIRNSKSKWRRRVLRLA